MRFLLPVLFLIVPLIELWAIIQVGSVIGTPLTILLLVVDSIIGAFIVRREGRRAWAAFRMALAEARWPGDEVAQGALVLVGGALLLTPGFVTDILGLSFVLPPTRVLWSKVVRSRMTVVSIGSGLPGMPGQPQTGDMSGHMSGHIPEVIEVEVLRVERNDLDVE